MRYDKMNGIRIDLRLAGIYRTNAITKDSLIVVGVIVSDAAP